MGIADKYIDDASDISADQVVVGPCAEGAYLHIGLLRDGRPLALLHVPLCDIAQLAQTLLTLAEQHPLSEAQPIVVPASRLN